MTRAVTGSFAQTEPPRRFVSGAVETAAVIYALGPADPVGGAVMTTAMM
ncbi:hypothetical protein [Nocardia carnea]|nr:hypothetical protein [Nocardia carnea]